MDDARLFLARVLPWAPLGDPNAYFNVHWTYQKTGYGKPGWGGRGCSSIEEMIGAVTFAQRGADTRDIYLCMSSQRFADAKITTSGYGYNVAKREAKTAVHLRSLFIDLDVKAKSYATPADAYRALIDFIKAVKLPMPTLMVQSGGGGLHVYWCLDVALTRDEWQPLANALAEATRRHNLVVDTACTVDSARVLRIPGTVNKKYNPPTQVKLLSHVMQPSDVPFPDMYMALEPYMADAAPEQQLTPRGKLEGFVSNLSAGIEKREARPVLLETLKESCGFIREALDTGGAAFQYPLWHLTTLISTFSEDGRTYAHKMAAGHKDYSIESTDALYENKLADKEARDLGWPKCSSVQNAGCTSCATCPMLALGKSPLNLGKSAPSPFVPSNDLPPGYQRDQHDRIIRLTIDEKGEAQQYLVSPYPIRNGWVQKSPWTLHFSTRFDHDTKDTPVSVSLVDVNSDGMSKRLGLQGIGLKRRDGLATQEFLVSWIKTLQNIKDRVVSSAPFGWCYTNGAIEGFCYGGTVWMDNNQTRPTGLPDGVLARQYTPQGNLDAWKKAANIITSQNRPALDMFLATSFGAPLLMFTGHEGALTSAYSTESGIGKSTAMKVAQAVWGHPVSGIQGLDDTINSTIHKIGSTKNLPLFWDELKTEEDIAKFVNFTFKITGGKEKSRLNGDGSQRELGSWQTIVMAASNDSLLDHIVRKTKTTTAGIYRVLEYTVAPIDVAKNKLIAGEVARCVGDLSNNFGQAGLIYATYLGNNQATIRTMVAQLQDTLNDKLKGQTDERFWIANAACAIAGAILSNKLGLTTINIHTLSQFLIDTIEQMRGVIKQSPSDMRSGSSLSIVMQQFYSFIRSKHLLITNKTLIGKGRKGRPQFGQIEFKSDITRLEGVYAQVAVDDGVMHISRTQMREWLVKAGYGPNIVFQSLISQWGATEVNGTLGAGTRLAAFSESLIQIDLTLGSTGGKFSADMFDINQPHVDAVVSPAKQAVAQALAEIAHDPLLSTPPVS